MDTFYNDENNDIRIGNIEIFLECAIDNFLLAQKNIIEIQKLKPPTFENIERLFELRLGSRFFKEIIDTLRMSAKWKIVPRLAYGQKLDESKNYFEYMKQLIIARNKLAHYKTKVNSEDNTKRSIENYKF